MRIDTLGNYVEDTMDRLVTTKRMGIARTYCGCGDYQYSKIGTVNENGETRYKYRCKCGNMIDIVVRRKV